MRVTFRRFPGHSSAYSVVERDDGVVYRMKEFTRAGTRLPHDLRHFVVERELGIADGIWGGIAAGMVYTSTASGDVSVRAGRLDSLRL
jgi:formylmethanofuran:tetrahydromethanopterin formyltransferase